MSYHWSLHDAHALLVRMASCVQSLQYSIARQYEAIVPTEEWTPHDGAMMRDLGKWALDGTPTSDLGTGDGILPGLLRAQESATTGLLTPLTLFNFAVVFARDDALSLLIDVDLLFRPANLGRKTISTLEDLALDIAWLTLHTQRGWRDTTPPSPATTSAT